jgi:FKBP-type peptidyl-prolyl cis-trans isomerase 2
MKIRGIQVMLTIVLAAFIFMAGRGPVAPGTAKDGGSERAAKTGDRVCVDYIGKFPDGTVFDTSVEAVAKDSGNYNSERNYEPLCFTIGAHQVVPGFENGAIGLKIGESKDVTLPPDQAYGERKQELVVPVPMTTFGQKPQIGEVYGFTDSASGQMLPGRVDAIDDASGQVFVDFNSEMAGKTLLFNITMRNIG